MKKSLLLIGISLLSCFLFLTNISAQGTYGNNLFFNFAWTSGQTGVAGASWTSPAIGTENSTITVTAPAANPSSRSKQGYTQALKCTGVEISQLSSLGYVGFAVQNGSGSAAATFQIQVWDGSAWITTETITLAGNVDAMLAPTSPISKSASRVRYVSSNSSWFYGVKAYSHIDAANAANASALLSVAPLEGSNLPGDGAITLQFDELVKVGSGTVSLGNATISSVQYLGSKVVVNYTGFTDATNPLFVPAASVTDYSGTPLTADISKTYALDVTPPSFVSAAPVGGSTVFVADLGLDARKIKLTFNEPILLGTGTVVFNGAIATASVSGSVLTISYKGLPYSSANTLTIPATLVKDLSGNFITGDITLTYNTDARDAINPTLTTQSVADLATAQPCSGSISFTFDDVVIPGTVPVTINGNPAYISNNGNIIGLNYTNLAYGSTVNVVLPAGCVTDTCGNQYAGTSFSFTIAAKADKAVDYVVAQDGSGNFTTIQAAINAASGTARTIIYVKPGVYTEKLLVNKNFISIIGEARDKVIISHNECSSTSTLQAGSDVSNTGTDASYTMLIQGSNFYGENFTVRNDFDNLGQVLANEQAVALEHITGDKSVLKNIKMWSYQDTYYPKSINTRQYLLNCEIHGGTDFIFGSGTCFIDEATIKCIHGGQYITAASDTQKEFGIVVNNSNISYSDTTGFGGPTVFYMGRPWKVPAKTAFINNKFEAGLLRAEGWATWSSAPENHLSAVYNEYNSTDLANTPLVLTSRVTWSKQLSANEASRYNPDNAFNFGASNTWNGKALTIAPATPANVSANPNGVITWDAVDFAVGYLVYRNDSLIGSTSNTTFTSSPIPNWYDTYSVKAYNENGATSVKSTGVTTKATETVIDLDFLKATVVEGELVVINETITEIAIIDLSGKTVLSAKSNATINVSSLAKGSYVVKGITADNKIAIEKIIKK